MGKPNVNTALNDLSGRIDSWIYRKVRGRTVVAKRPVPTTKPPTAAQEAVLDRFRIGAGYAKSVLADPVRRLEYEAIALQQNRVLRTTVMTDYMKEPVVKMIDLAGFHGAVGDPIKVDAVDDCPVPKVHVSVRQPDGTVLEEGLATLSDGLWVYYATTARTPGESVSIVATATDRPGNTGSKTVSRMI